LLEQIGLEPLLYFRAGLGASWSYEAHGLRVRVQGQQVVDVARHPGRHHHPCGRQDLICVLSLNTLHCAGYGPTPEPDRCIIAARQGGRYALLVSQPEIQRQVRQQRGDIDALYELVERVDQKIDALDVKVDRRFDEISGQLSEVLRQLRDR